jgi:hypothetical protein
MQPLLPSGAFLFGNYHVQVYIKNILTEPLLFTKRIKKELSKDESWEKFSKLR